MKINGKKIDKPSAEICVIPRETGDIVFKAEAVLDFTEFDKLCPEPEMKRQKNVKTGSVKMIKGKDYEQLVEEHATARMNYMIIKSLESTDGLEWDNIDISKPETWSNYEDELQESGLSMAEINMIVNIVLVANSLDDRKYKEARERFLASQSKKA